jgi:4-hydroxybenzoate polyprenyltransferase
MVENLGWQRWWIYQQERFPVVSNGILIVMFSSAMVSYGAVVQGAVPTVRSQLVAFLVFFLAFLQLRIADEFKDYEDDCRHRPERPVPRGLIHLTELQYLDWATRLIQVIFSVNLDPTLVLLLALIWGYQFLMQREFFRRDWLKQHPAIYLLSHNLILPILGLYGIACGWLPGAVAFPWAALWLLPISSCHGVVIEVGRKVRSPREERPGVETYTALWGRENALLVWLIAIGGGGITTLLAALYLPTALGTASLLLIAGGVICWLAYLFLNAPSPRSAKLIYLASALWVLVSYSCLGWMPLVAML